MIAAMRFAGIWRTMLVAFAAATYAPLAATQDALAIVVSASHPAKAIDAQTLALMYMRKKERWPDGRRVQPVNLPADDPLRRQFSLAVLQQTPAGLDDYWNEQYFHGVLPPHVVRSQAAMARFVAATEGAIGYLRYCGLPDGLRVLLIVGDSGRLLGASEPLPVCPPSAAADPVSR